MLIGISSLRPFISDFSFLCSNFSSMRLLFRLECFPPPPPLPLLFPRRSSPDDDEVDEPVVEELEQ
jgi:hypothetical protein